MLNALSRLKATNPLLLLTLIALLPRLLASFFAPGYFAHDDHFLVIEAAQSWVDGFDYNNWLPWNQGEDAHATGHSFFYVGMHFLLFSFLDLIGAQDPESNMVIVRLLHALWSLITVRCGYRIARHLGNESIAWKVGLMLALFYFMPFLSVRNLPEMVCVPLIMLAAERIIRAESDSLREILIAGLFLGIAANLRFQTMAFVGGIGLALLLQKRFKESILFGLVTLAPLVIIQGGLDLYLWKKPFVEIAEYVRYNFEHTKSYINHPWYQYGIVIAGVLIPPFSLLLLYGVGRISKRTAVVTVGMIAFIVIHSFISNKQERFILPVVPLIITLGGVGFLQWKEQWSGGSWIARIWPGVKWFTLVINSIVLVVLLFSYSKRSRVEIMYALQPHAKEVKHLMVENTIAQQDVFLPQYYSDGWQYGQWPVFALSTELQEKIVRYTLAGSPPNYVVFVGEEDLNGRMERLSELMPGQLFIIGKAEPGLLDRILHWLNPLNRNEVLILTQLRPPAAN
jgi:4-amino-4-deoxy-L-arabinose transferase-like glycosyltransferase